MLSYFFVVQIYFCIEKRAENVLHIDVRNIIDTKNDEMLDINTVSTVFASSSEYFLYRKRKSDINLQVFAKDAISDCDINSSPQ